MYKIRCADVNDARVLGEIHWGLNELKNRGYNKVTLWVLEENLNARRFYEKIGFKHDGTTNEITLGKKLKELRYEPRNLSQGVRYREIFTLTLL